MDSCEKISNSITAAKELIENEARSLAALHKAKQLEKELRKSGGKSSVSCPLKPSDSAPLKHSTMPP